MNRRQFFRSCFGVGVAVATAPSLADLFAPPTRGLTIEQIMSVAYEQIFVRQQETAQMWADAAFLRDLERYDEASSSA